MIRIFIGFDTREPVACNVLAHSIRARSSVPVSITALVLSQLKPFFSRDMHPLQSTEFSFSRFLVPHLSGFEGWSLFTDCDMLVLDDIAKLWALRDDRFALMVIKHDHQPRESVKFLGAPQTAYAKKNWSSVMLFNNALCRALSTEYVNVASGLDLHQFKWLANDQMIGSLPRRWNHLVGYDEPSDDVSLVHYTIGGPYFEAYARCEHAAAWFSECEAMRHAGSRK